MWRQDTYDALARAAAETRWPGYAQFASLLGKGLRVAALDACRTFDATLSGADFDARWAFTAWLLEEILAPKVVTTAVVPMPLRTGVVVPTLWEAIETRPSDPRAAAWLVSRFREEVVLADPTAFDPVDALLTRQLERTPAAPMVERSLANHLLGRVEDDAHHLHESRYLGEPEANRTRLERVRELIPDAADPMRVEADAAARLLDAWIACTAAGAEDFPAWCREHGVPPPQGATFYYGAASGAASDVPAD